jgi:hypothetical protein
MAETKSTRFTTEYFVLYRRVHRTYYASADILFMEVALDREDRGTMSWSTRRKSRLGRPASRGPCSFYFDPPYLPVQPSTLALEQSGGRRPIHLNEALDETIAWVSIVYAPIGVIVFVISWHHLSSLIRYTKRHSIDVLVAARCSVRCGVKKPSPRATYAAGVKALGSHRPRVASQWILAAVISANSSVLSSCAQIQLT